MQSNRFFFAVVAVSLALAGVVLAVVAWYAWFKYDSMRTDFGGEVPSIESL